MKLYYSIIFLFASFGFNSHLYSVGIEPVESDSEENFQDAIQEAQDVVNNLNPEQIVREAYHKIEEIDQENDTKKRLAFIQDNPLWSYKIKIPYQEENDPEIKYFNINTGMFKRDIKDVAIYGANMTADFLFVKHFQNTRINNITKHILETYPKVIESLKAINSIPQIPGLLGNIKTIQEKTKKMNEWADKELCSLCYNPKSKYFFLNPKVLPIIIAKLLYNKASTTIEKNVAMPDYEQAIKTGAFYYKSENENSQSPLFSPMLAVKFLTNSSLFYRTLSLHYQSASKAFNKVTVGDFGSELNWKKIICKAIGLNIPDWVFDPKFVAAVSGTLDVLFEALAVKMYDNYFNEQLKLYMSKNNQKLLTLLEEYSELKKDEETNAEKIISVEKQVKDFISDAHKLTKWHSPFSIWNLKYTFDSNAKFLRNLPIILPVFGLYCYGYYRLIKAIAF